MINRREFLKAMALLGVIVQPRGLSNTINRLEPITGSVTLRNNIGIDVARQKVDLTHIVDSEEIIFPVTTRDWGLVTFVIIERPGYPPAYLPVLYPKNIYTNDQVKITVTVDDDLFSL
jgi:hypothetical protein